MEWADEKCVRCSKLPDWKTAALIYGGAKWDYYYCYECRRWFVRDGRYRYATASLDEPSIIRRLLSMLELQRQMTESRLEIFAWLRRRLSWVYRFFLKSFSWGMPH